MALEWTYRNISYFGGDADEITVGGHSAGVYLLFSGNSLLQVLIASRRTLHVPPSGTLSLPQLAKFG
jgi:acetyl esterase/lipase